MDGNMDTPQGGLWYPEQSPGMDSPTPQLTSPHSPIFKVILESV